MAEVLGVCRGAPRPIPGKKAKTGIYKEPVDAIHIGQGGVRDDAVLDSKHHGGADQAVYLYFADDYRFWDDELGTHLVPGSFGENLVIEGVEGRAVAAGDRFAIGPVLLEVTSHRTPCMTFALKMGDRGWVKRFHRANRPGAYARVLAEGEVRAGAGVDYRPFGGERFTVSQMMALDGVREPDPALMRRALQTPIHQKMRADFEQRLARLF